MCGIAGIHILNPDNAPKWTKIEDAIDTMFAAINHRGGDATGFVAVGDEDVVWQKASCDAFDFYKERKNIPWRTRSVLLHTRMATQGLAAFPENNHPIRRDSVYVVHNGHIWNDRDVFRMIKSSERHGQVDSEAIAALIADYGIKETHKAMEELSGAAAIGAIDANNPGLMVLARSSSSPLMFYHNENVAVFGSTLETVTKAWKVLYGTAPKSNKIEEVKEGVALYLENGTISRERFTPDDYFYSYSGNYTGGKSVYHKSWKDNDPYEKLYEDEELDALYSEPNVTFVVGGNVYCGHNCLWDDCEICNPDDINGSYLPATVNAHDFIRNGQWVKGVFIPSCDIDSPTIDPARRKKPWIDAEECDLCGDWFPADELVTVDDWEDKWIFCGKCTEEMSDVIEEVGTSTPTRFSSIHDLPMHVEI